MQTFTCHVVYFRQNLWAAFVEPEVKTVWTFITEYCRNNNMQLNADEWIVMPPVPALIGKSIMDSLKGPSNPMNISARLPNYIAQEGNLRVKPHVRGYD
jgi:hypothetical protein